MKSIKVIPYSKMLSLSGRKMGLMFLRFVCIFLILLEVLCLYIVCSGQTSDVLEGILVNVTLISLVLFLYYFSFNVKEKDYIAGKTFKIPRMSKEKQRKLLIWFVVILIFVCLLSIIDGQWNQILTLIGGVIAFYYFAKSLKFHENVDYVVNQSMEELIGVNIDEKICASYQNFDNAQKQCNKGDNLLVITNRKIFYANYNGETWLILKRNLNELTKIGYIDGYMGNDYYLGMEFSDTSSMCFKMGVMEKLTSNPSLFMKQFLDVLDAYVLGYDLAKNKSRRRVPIDSNNIERKGEVNVSYQTLNSARKVNLELGEEILSQIKVGDEIISGRKIEL